jgi:hypothetical protein
LAAFFSNFIYSLRLWIDFSIAFIAFSSPPDLSIMAA